MADASWLEISLTVDGELAEAVAEVLARYATNGVVVESGVEYNDTEEMGIPVGPVRVYGYLPVDEKLEDIRQRTLESLWYLGRITPLPEPEFRNIADQDWMVAWKKNYHPIPIGKKLLILPAWMEPSEPGRMVVRIDPSMAFGTGTHPTTQLCLALTEDYLQPGQNIIDVGCGSGILSIAALKLGAAHALGVDIDPESTRSSRENAEANGISDSLELGLGSVAELCAGQFSIKQAPIVLVNILAPIIVRLFEDGLADLVEPGGTLILSGILVNQVHKVETAASERGLVCLQRQQVSDWVALAYRK
jgi:ribosomal protein L11 methyltransferase